LLSSLLYAMLCLLQLPIRSLGCRSEFQTASIYHAQPIFFSLPLQSRHLDHLPYYDQIRRPKFAPRHGTHHFYSVTRSSRVRHPTHAFDEANQNIPRLSSNLNYFGAYLFTSCRLQVMPVRQTCDALPSDCRKTFRM
jgi:hypothetical protein